MKSDQFFSKLTRALYEGISQEDLADVLYNALERRMPDVVTKYGHEVVGNVILDVASFYQGLDELGTSDISIMLRTVIKQLEEYNKETDLTEVSQETLSSYKKKAGIEASRLDKEAFGNVNDPKSKEKIEKANKRFRGILRATQKQLDKDVKKEVEEGQIYFQGGGGSESQRWYEPRKVPNQNELDQLDELKCWPGYTRVQGVPAGKPGSCKKKTKESSIMKGLQTETNQELEENLRKWFDEKWVRFGPDGKIRGACARGDNSEGKPKCLPQKKAHSLGKKGRKYAASKKRREDPNPERSGKAINVATKKKSNEDVTEGINNILPNVLYHGGQKPINKFIIPQYGVYFSPHVEWAKNYGDVITQAKVKANRVYLIDYSHDIDDEIVDALFDRDYETVAKFIKLLQKQGYQAMQTKTDSEMVVVFPGTQIEIINTEKESVAEEKCPHCNGPMFSELMINEKKDACYYKVKSRYKVWPSAYASGALVKCRKKGASNWGTGGKKSESVSEGQDSIVDKCASLAAKYFNDAGLQREYDIDEFIKINAGDNVAVDKCASLAAKYFNDAGLQREYDIDEYIKVHALQGVAEGYEPGDKVTWYYSNHYPEVEGTVVGIKDGKYRIKSVCPLPGQKHTDPAIYAVPKNNIMSHTKQGAAEGLEQNIPPVLYHATYKPRLKNIKLKGLGAGGKRNWEDSQRGIVYLALDPNVAESYAETSDMVPDEWLDQIVILKISTAGLDPNNFHIDSNVQDNQGDTVEYHGVIPLTNISLYKQGVAEAKPSGESTHWRVEQSEATGRYHVVTGYQKRKVWANKLGAIDFVSKDAAQKKADELNQKENVTEGFKNTYNVGDRVNTPIGPGVVTMISNNVNIDGKVKVKLDDPSRAGEDGKYKDEFVFTTNMLKHLPEQGMAEGNDQEFHTGGSKGLPFPGTYEQENNMFKTKGPRRITAMTYESQLDEKWSEKYKRSINCNNPKGFSQKAHCQGRKKK